MLRAVILGHEPETGDALESVLAGIGHVAIVRKAEDYRPGALLEPFLRDHAPNFIFLGLRQFGQALECARQLESRVPQLPIVAVDTTCEAARVLELMRAGVRELLAAPFEISRTRAVLSRVAAQVEKTPPCFPETQSVFAFLPAQGGAGSSLVAANTAVALAEVRAHRSLLIDCDVINGLSRLFFGGEALYTLVDIAPEADQLDGERWREMVMTHRQLDLIVGGRGGADRRLEASHMRHLLGYARRSYDAICLDVPGLTKVMLETLGAASNIFIVCTPEANSLFLAREKSRLLSASGLGDKVAFLVNRMDRRALFSRAACEELLGQKVLHVLPNDYDTVQRAIRSGCPVEAGSAFGRSIRSLGGMLMDHRSADGPAPLAHKFLENFFVGPSPLAG
jgi:pilus assembly protein CpaE